MSEEMVGDCGANGVDGCALCDAPHPDHAREQAANDALFGIKRYPCGHQKLHDHPCIDCIETAHEWAMAGGGR